MIDEQPGAALSHELYKRGEQVDRDLDRLIAARADGKSLAPAERGSESAVEKVWELSEREHAAALQAQRRAERRRYHQDHADRLEATMGELVRYHRQEADRFLPALEQRTGGSG